MFFQIELLVLACYFQVIVVSFHVLPALFAQLRHPFQVQDELLKFHLRCR